MATILLVDDDATLADMMERSLVRAGHRVAVARDGEEGVRLYDPAAFDLVVTDLIMPVKEGLELIADLRRKNPSVKIVAMSGGMRDRPGTSLPIAKGFGAERILEKPFSNAQLHEAIDAVLAGK